MTGMRELPPTRGRGRLLPNGNERNPQGTRLGFPEWFPPRGRGRFNPRERELIKNASALASRFRTPDNLSGRYRKQSDINATEAGNAAKPQELAVASVASLQDKSQTQPPRDVDVVVGGKPSLQNKQRQHTSKMHDVNRKGAEKEGDVEALPEEVAPAPSQPTALVPVVARTNKVIVKDEESEADKEEKLVAAYNQENTNLSSSSSTHITENIPPNTLSLKYSYKKDQWSPCNPEGKKKYERDFLLELRNDPQSKKKPKNLPEVVLKDNSNRRLGDRLRPEFWRRDNSQGVNKNVQQGKQDVIYVRLSLNDDVKLNKTENAWKPTRLKKSNIGEDEVKTEELYKKVRGVLNKLTPEKFNSLITQVQSLPIDNSERLKGVINIIFQKAVDEPNFSAVYAQMCKFLGTMQVPGERNNKNEQPENMNFRKLLISRCRSEFEKNTEVNLNMLKEIEEATDPEKKKEIHLQYEKEERRVRMKSLGNIRFIGELFKLGMLTTNTMNSCIKSLLSDGNEESLERLCKLLTTVGKDLESKQDLSSCFSKLREISHKRGEVSSRVRFMLQDVIDLQQNKWIPRRDDSNPKTLHQIQKEAEKEELNQQPILNSAPQTPREQDDRAPPSRKNRENRQARGAASRSSSRDNSLRGGGTSLRTYAASLQPPSMSASTEDISGSGKSLRTTPPAAAVPKLSDEEVQKKTHNLLKEFLNNTNYKESESLVQETFSITDHSTFVRETLNAMMEQKSSARINVGDLMNHVIKSGAISLSSYIIGLNEFLGFADDIAIDVPKFWPYTAEVIVPLLSSETMAFADLRKVAQPTHGKLIAELLDLLVKDKGPVWIQDKWSAAGLKWKDFVPDDEVDNFVTRYKLDYVLGRASTVPSASSSTPINWDHVQQPLPFIKSVIG